MIQQLEKDNVEFQVDSLNKTVEKSAVTLLLDITQTHQYRLPLNSTIREIVCNGKDSIQEKNVALSILNGKSRVEDHYISREGDLYKDSKWDPNYYDTKYLSNNDDVTIEYFEHPIDSSEEGTGTLVITDYGVGIGDDRIAGYCKIGYSSKRNTLTALGAFGLGAKSPLALDAGYYIMESAHNGKKVRLQIHDYKVVSLIPTFNVKMKKPNKFHEITRDEGEPFRIYYEETNEKNYTKIIIPIITHTESMIRDVIKNTLCYIDKVQYWYIKDNKRELIPFKYNVEYESSNLLITDSNRWSAVEICIIREDDGRTTHDTIISYGPIDFRQMGQNNINGAIAIKCPIRSAIKNADGTETVIQEGVNVIPSREGIRYDKHTIEFIKKRFNQAVLEAQDLVSKAVNSKDFLKWLHKCADIFAGANSDATISKLFDIVSKGEVSTIFPGYTAKQIKFDNSIWKCIPGINIRRTVVKTNYTYNKGTTYRLERERLSSFSELFRQGDVTKKIWIKESTANQVKDAFLLSSLNTFYTIEVLSDEAITALVTDGIKERMIFKNQETLTDKDNKAIEDEAKREVERIKKEIPIYLDLFKQAGITKYEDITLTESDIRVGKKYLQDRSITEGGQTANSDVADVNKTLAEIRKEKGLILAYNFDKSLDHSSNYSKINIPKDSIINKKIVPKVYYGTSDDVLSLTRGAVLYSSRLVTDIHTSGILILKLNKNNAKLFEKAGYDHIDDLFKNDISLNEQDKMLMFRRIKNTDFMTILEIFCNFTYIDLDLTKTCNDLNTSIRKISSNLPSQVLSGEYVEDLLTHLKESNVTVNSQPVSEESLIGSDNYKTLQYIEQEYSKYKLPMDALLKVSYRSLPYYFTNYNEVVNLFNYFKNIKQDGEQKQ